MARVLGASTDEVLNPPDEGEQEALSSADLVQQMQVLLGFAADTGSPTSIDPRAFREAHDHFRRKSQGLAAVRLQELANADERKAFWINLYNTLILDGVLTYQIANSMRDFSRFFMQIAYLVDDLRFSADDIEHGILRANRGHPAVPGPQFARGDRRRNFVLATLDPRIHFALNCGAESCPPIGIYSPEVLDRQLDLAVQAFNQNGGVQIDRQNGTVALSAIYRWYAHDFGGAFYGLGAMQPVLDFVAGYCGDPAEADFLRTGKPHIRYLPYKWKISPWLRSSR
jgi:hypothetical protein